MALGIVLTIKADLGVAPWDVLHIGLYYQFGLTIGSWSIIIGIFILAISSLIMKSWPKYGSFLNMLLVGIFIDFFMLLPFLQTPSVFFGKLLMLLIGVVILAFGMGLYISGSIGAGPRDSLMLAFHLKMGWKVQNVRLCMEVMVLFIGFLLGGPVSIGTLIVTVALSYLAGFMIPFCRKLTDRFVATISLRPKTIINTKDIA
ncbi:YczE/YyaS/YitT family protein [Bacillus kwashiorkori]|uniref:YczE/YyaS/YitT family protein n=1 Tax=Bacillus kwashiorkori TaxID=1522318 RepID=UPI001EF11753|nr:YitT family protein [Bacillus kwashiorkori]